MLDTTRPTKRIPSAKSLTESLAQLVSGTAGSRKQNFGPQAYYFVQCDSARLIEIQILLEEFIVLGQNQD